MSAAISNVEFKAGEESLANVESSLRTGPLSKVEFKPKFKPKKGKFVKLCLHSSCALQNSFQFDDCFSTFEKCGFVNKNSLSSCIRAKFCTSSKPKSVGVSIEGFFLVNVEYFQDSSKSG